MTTYAIEALHSDQGTIVVFEGWRTDVTFGNCRACDDDQSNDRAVNHRPGHDTTTYLIAVDHRMAQAIVDDLEGGEPVIVEAEGWQIVGTVG